MKTLKLFTLGLLFFAASSIQAQVSINVNLGTAPSWGPAGYSSVDYYYLPDVESYYDIRAKQFIYLNGGTWVRTKYLPRQYRNYDLYNGYKVVLNDYHGPSPYTYFKNDKVKYYKGYKGGHQKSIGNRNDNHGDSNNHNDRGHGGGGHKDNGHGGGKGGHGNGKH
ncbi:hypothetical protein [Flavobacterium psychrotolerans]|uniref:DUF3300 domain-containing protein n=1 Tax=Flavobacterium psychrotolerans TaxID=2169410 RepID=A0A2U1JQM6_9FLAO|nr:hypothetical protein [Flavobacterium psychrotolerans]PWA07315.1 hypothetical protein DB895_00920 [Flavobacterium psychrotolerans]